MEANKAPEKLYLLPDDRNPNGLSICWYEAPYVTGSIEYTRTDAFIEKAQDFFKQSHHLFGLDGNELYHFIEDFKRYTEE